MQDGSESIFLSTCGKNDNEVPEELVKFLRFVKADLEESTKDFEDEYVKRLQKSVQAVKVDCEMEERFMLFEELLRDERKEGKVEARIEDLLETLEILENLPEELREKIENEKDLNKLKFWFKRTLEAESICQFMENMD